MSKTKRIIKGILEGGLEVVKDSAKQVASTVSPTALLESAIGPKKGSEVTQYLQNLSDPNLSPEQLKENAAQIAKKDEKELEKTRALLTTTPAHMKVAPTAPSMSAYEATVAEMEQKKALAVEMQKKQQSQSATAPKGKVRGNLFGKKKFKGSEGLAKDTKIG